MMNLMPPYGNCGQNDLHYFDHYELATCIRECLINITLDTCHCLAPFMMTAKTINSKSFFKCSCDTTGCF